MGEMIRIAAPVATVKAITKAPARAVLTTREVTIKEVTTKAAQIKEVTIKEGTTRAAQTREADANATTAKRSPIRMGEHTEPAEGWHLVSSKNWKSAENFQGG